MARGLTVRLSDAEAWHVLAAAHTGIFTTLRADGVPISLPVWFVVIDHRVYVSGPSHTKKFARLQRDPRCSFLVESGQRWSDLRAVHVVGTARVVDDEERLARVARALDEKYGSFRMPLADMPDATRRHYEVETTTIEITPEPRILSWDNHRIAPGDRPNSAGP